VSLVSCHDSRWAWLLALCALLAVWRLAQGAVWDASTRVETESARSRRCELDPKPSLLMGLQISAWVSSPPARGGRREVLRCAAWRHSRRQLLDKGLGIGTALGEALLCGGSRDVIASAPRDCMSSLRVRFRAGPGWGRTGGGALRSRGEVDQRHCQVTGHGGVSPPAFYRPVRLTIRTDRPSDLRSIGSADRLYFPE
jgi:hypothetical protein